MGRRVRRHRRRDGNSLFLSMEWRKQMHNITSVGVLSLAKVMGLFGALMGVVVSIPYALIMVLFSGLMASGGEAGGAAVGGVGALMTIILVPLGIGVLNFIGGLIYGLVLNFVLAKTGGLELSLEKNS